MLTGSFIAELLCIMEAIIRTLGSWPYLALSSSTAMTTLDLSRLPSSSQTFLSPGVLSGCVLCWPTPSLDWNYSYNFNEENI